MKITTLEEYGLRCVLQMARKGQGQSTTIPELSRLEALSLANTAKLLRLLRKGGLIQSQRGSKGGYVLTRPAEKISVQDVLDAVGGKFKSGIVCERQRGGREACIHRAGCSMQSLWGVLEGLLNNVLDQCMVSDLLDPEHTKRWIETRIAPVLASSERPPDVFPGDKGVPHA
jgi:Rrf2 family protein